MSTPNPNDPASNTTDPNAAADPPRSAGSTSLLWILLLAALIALGWWWYSKQPAPTAPTEPAVIEQPVASDEAAAATEQEAAAARQAAAKKPAAKPRPVTRITRDPTPLASNQVPKYPAQALRSGVEGSVSVRIEVDANGVPGDVKVVERSGERSRDLDRAVINAVRSWRFEPAMKDGKAVAGAVVLPVDFKRE